MSEIDIEQLNKAKRLFFAGVTFDNIVSLTKIKPFALREAIDRVPNGWRAIRDASEDLVVTSATIDRLNTALSCAGVASSILLDSLKELKHATDSGRVLSIKEMKGVSDIVDSLDKIIRLERGTPTDIVCNASLSIEEARDILKKDPFAEAIEAEIVEPLGITHES